MPLDTVSQASLDRIMRSGEYVCRPHRQIFAEHELYTPQGQVGRKASKEDLLEIARVGNDNAMRTGDLALLGIGHTFDDIKDANGNIIRKFSEAEQPKPIGYLHNYTVEPLLDGRWALFADQWVQKVIYINDRGDPDISGKPVDGRQYVETFPRRSPEYFPGRKFIDWLALLRRTPALNMGLDVAAYAYLNPDKSYYRMGTDGAMLLAAVVDSKGKWRYAAEDDMDEPKPSSPAAPNDPPAGGPPPMDTPPAGGPPPNSPAAPADDRPVLPNDGGMNEGLPDLHKTCAEKYAAHCYEMHHSQQKALLHHAHSLYAAALGLPPDKMAPHNPAPAIVPGAVPGTTPVSPGGPATPAPAAPPSPAAPAGPPPHLKNDAASPPATGPSVPGATNAFIPGEVKRMSAVQQDIEKHRFASDLEKERYARQQLEARLDVIEREKRQMAYERELTNRLNRGVSMNLVKEMERAQKWDYASDRCAEQLACIDENYPKAPIGDSFIDPIMVGVTGALPSRGGPQLPEKTSYEENQKAKKYAAKHGCEFNEALEKIRGA